MPTKKRSLPPGRRGIRRYKKRYYKAYNAYHLQGYAAGLPLKRNMRLKYATNFTITSTMGSCNYFLLRANGCHDPDYSSGGSNHQPLFWDTMKLLYNHYTVRSSSIRISCMPAGTGTPLAAVCGVFLDDDVNSTYTDWTGYSECNRGKHKKSLLRTTDPLQMSMTFNARKFFNITDIKDNTARIGSVISTDPAEMAIFRVYFQTLDASTVSGIFTAEITYNIEFSEPADIAQS